MFIVAVLAVSSLLGAPAPQPSDSARAEQERWQGEWKIEEMEIMTGTRTARLKFKPDDMAAWVVKADHLQLIGLNFPYTEATLQFARNKDPKRLTLQLLEDAKPGPKVEATYTREGNTIAIQILNFPRDKEGDTATVRFMLVRPKD